MSAPMPSRPAWRILALLLPLLSSGCGGLLPEPPKRQMYRLDPTFVAATLPRLPVQLLVATPTAPAGLDTQRIALSSTPVSLDYYAEAEWSDRAPFLVQTALVEGFDKSRAVAGVGPESFGLTADFVLETTIRDFEAVYDSPKAPPRVLVRLDVKLVRLIGRKIVAASVLSGEQTAAANAVPDIVVAFDRAMGMAVQRVVGWAVATPGLSERRRSVR